MANIFNGNTYQLVTTGASYASAKIAAVDAGGYLVIINSQAENDFVYGLLNDANITTTATDGGSAQYAWLGATDEVVEGDWRWVDGTSLTYSNWGSGYYPDGSYNTEPDNTIAAEAGAPNGQDYAAMGMESWPSGYDFSLGQPGQWNDVAGSNALAYVIEIPIVSTSSSSDAIDNTGPTDIVLDSSTVAKAGREGSLHVANIIGTVPDEDNLTYTITGGSEFWVFQIVDSMLHLSPGGSGSIEAYDTETPVPLVVELTATNSTGLSYSESFTISVTDIDEEKNDTSSLIGSEFQVGTTGGFTSQVSFMQDGGFLVSYKSVSTLNQSITGILYDAQGSTVGTGLTISNSSNDYWHLGQDVLAATVSDEVFVVVWDAFSDGDNHWDTFGQLYDSSGEALGNDFQINSHTLGYQENSCVAGLSNGGFVVTWESYGVASNSKAGTSEISSQDYGLSKGIFGQRYDLNGKEQGGEFQVNSYITGDQEDACVAGLSNGGFVVTWESSGQDGLETNVYGQLYSFNGKVLGDEFKVNSQDFGYDQDAKVVGLTGGNFVVTWESFETPSESWTTSYAAYDDSVNSGVFGQLYDSNGSKTGNQFRISTLKTVSQEDPVITSLEDGGFVVIWFSGQYGSNQEFYGQRYDSAANKVGSEFQVETASSTPKGLSVAGISDGGFVVTWVSGDSDNSIILGQRYDHQGNPIDLVVSEVNSSSGTSNNDQFDGFSGASLIDGGLGIDVVNYSFSSETVTFSFNYLGQLLVQEKPDSLYGGKDSSSSSSLSDTLTNIERLQFTDKVYALDIDENAGIASKVIITTFGIESLELYMSAALSVVDAGTTLEGLCNVVVDLKLIDQVTGSSSNGSFIDQVFLNVVGRSPNLLESSLYTSYLENGTYTRSSLLALAANTTLVENLVTENLVDLIGVAGSADGQILALQYDIGLN